MERATLLDDDIIWFVINFFYKKIHSEFSYISILNFTQWYIHMYL